MKVLLTGSRGMVGKNIMNNKLASEFNIYNPSRDELDLRNKKDVYKYLEKINPDLIIHAAGKVGGIGANILQPYEFLYENLELNMNIISCALDIGVKKLINLASSCIYPKDESGNLSEEMILRGGLEPTNEGYALAKIAALRMCEYASAKNVNVHYKTLIPCNLYGPNDDFELKTAHLVPAIISKIHCTSRIYVC